MLPVTSDDVRLFLHVLAATVWVGGQLVVLALVAPLRAAGPDVPGVAARRFAVVAWPAFLVLVATGVWNLLDVPVTDASTEYQVTLAVKLGVVAISGVAAWVHGRARTPATRAISGAIALLAALAALLLGVVLRG
ncbi:MAG TPA: CopD family protein [Acidimicrobiia bacterium]